VKIATYLGRLVYHTDCVDDGSSDYLGDGFWRAFHTSVEAKVFFNVFSLLIRKETKSEYDYFESSTKESKSVSILVKSPFVSIADLGSSYSYVADFSPRRLVQFAFRKT
jgi:hypothetical protein